MHVGPAGLILDQHFSHCTVCCRDMDILDDWQRGQAHVPPPDAGIRADEEAFEVLDTEQPIFAIERVDRQISR